MALYKRGNAWWYKFTAHRTCIRRSTGTSNRKAAEQIEAAARIAVAKDAAGLNVRPPAPTLAEFSQRFADYIAIRCAAKAATVDFYAKCMKQLLDFEPLRNARLSAIDELLIERFVQHRAAAKRRPAPATINRCLATLRRALRLAHEWKLLDRVPRVRLLRGERQREAVLTPEQESAYLAVAPQPYRDLAVLLLDTGLRVGEACLLEWPDVHLDPAPGASHGWLHVRPLNSKNGKGRNIPLTQRASAMLAARWADRDGSGFVYRNTSCRPLQVSSVDHAHKRLRTALSLPADMVIHSFRHTYCTRLGEAGADAFTIMRLAGHSSVTVSQRYCHPTPAMLENAVARLEAMNAGRAAVAAASAPIAVLPAALPPASEPEEAPAATA